MPPQVSRKRNLDESSPPSTRPVKRQATSTPKPAAKPAVKKEIDTPESGRKKLEDNKRFLAAQEDGSEDEDEDSASGSGSDSDEFEDVELHHSKRAKHDHTTDDEEVDWEDAIDTEGGQTHHRHHKHHKHAQPQVPEYTGGGISITMAEGEDGLTYEAPPDLDGKKGPSKKERAARLRTHCMHVQFLMWHNAIRNKWINDKETHRILIKALPGSIYAEVERWRTAMQIDSEDDDLIEVDAKGKPKASKSKPKPGLKSQGKGVKARHRDWDNDAKKQKEKDVNVANGDPLVRLLRYLSNYWKKRFRVTAPGLRKRGYKPLKDIAADLKAFKDGSADAENFGEKIVNLRQWRESAKKCEGSRDVGHQLFTALLRALGIEARMVANLQSAGFGWTKFEEAVIEKKSAAGKSKKSPSLKKEVVDFSTLEDTADEVQPPKRPKSTKPAMPSFKPMNGAKPKLNGVKAAANGRKTRGSTSKPIILDNSSSDLSEPPSADEIDEELAAADSAQADTNRKVFDRDIAYPLYWTEVLSPATNRWVAVTVLVNPVIATTDEHYLNFEPRGAAADKARIVMAYIIAHNADGSAKDVTVRYLKRHMLPGRTKGVRLPAEKIAIHNRKGKVLRYEEHDWFKRVMAGYVRPSRQRTAADDIEDQTDLKPVKPEKKAKDGTGATGEETLQGYKSSKEFVLERHFRREEALVANAKSVKFFTVGKGASATSEPVFKRSDVITCKSVETWHKEGREVKLGEQPLKRVPYRAVTLARKREIEEATKEADGEKPLQGLYSKAQTDWIIPPPIGPDGVIPKNAFNNIDVYVPSMVPKGAVHIPLKGTAKLCRKLEIDHAEACTGFEFGKQRAVPVITGVVVVAAHEKMVREAWKEEQARVAERDRLKKEAACLTMWKKMLAGLRIIEKIRAEYKDDAADIPDKDNPFMNKKKEKKPAVKKEVALKHEELDNEGSVDHHGHGGFMTEEEMGGGFFAAGRDVEEVPRRGGGDGGFMTDDHDHNTTANTASELEIAYNGASDVEDTKLPAAVRRQSTKPMSMAAMAAAEGEESEANDDSEEEVDVKPKATSTRGRGGKATRARGRANEARRASTRKAIVSDEEDEDDDHDKEQENDEGASSHDEDSDNDEDEDFQSTTKATRGSSRGRARGRGRGATRGQDKAGRGGASLSVEEAAPKSKRKAATRKRTATVSPYFSNMSE